MGRASLRPRAERRWRRERKSRLPHQAAATDGHSRPCSLQLLPSHGISGGEEGERKMRFSKAWSSGAHYPAVSRGGDFPPFPRQQRRGRYSSPFTPFHASSPRYAGSAGSLLSGCLDSCPGGCPSCRAGWPGRAFPARTRAHVSTDAGGNGGLPAAAPAGYAGPCHGTFLRSLRPVLLDAPPAATCLEYAVRLPASFNEMAGKRSGGPGRYPRTGRGSGPIHRDSGGFFRGRLTAAIPLCTNTLAPKYRQNNG